MEQSIGTSVDAENKETILRSIEYLCLDLIRQLSYCEPNIILKVSIDLENKQLNYRSNMVNKLACDLYTLQQIYQLIIRSQKATKRDLYYENKMLYKTQAVLDRSITNACELLNRPREALNITSCSKGLIQGAIIFVANDDRTCLVDARSQFALISESLMKFRIVSSAKFILVVEKDAIFQKLVEESFFSVFPESILVTGKGYPDICTRRVLQWLVERLSVPIFAFVDADPHGIEIFMTYKYGSIKATFEGKGAFVPQIKWIGLFASDSAVYPIPSNQFIPLKNSDFSKITKIKRRAELLGETQIVYELNKMHDSRHKHELEAISVIGDRFLLLGLLEPRLRIVLDRTNAK